MTNGVLENFEKFTGKDLHQSLYFNKVEVCNFSKKETLTHVFSCEFREISKNNFFTEHLRTTASRCMIKCTNILIKSAPNVRNFNAVFTKDPTLKLYVES